MKKQELGDWLDQHHVEVIRTHATNLDGTGVGKHLHRDKFLNSLPKGHAISDMAVNMDHTGAPHMTSWHPQREANLGDIFLRPDLTTLIYDGPDPDLGHCIGDFTNAAGESLDLCPRSVLKKLVKQVDELGYEIKTTFELEFFLFQESFLELRHAKYRQMTPISAVQQGGGIYNIRNAYQVKPFMRELIKRMEWKGISWEGWNDEAGMGQVELNLTPLDPIKMADTVIRTKQMIYEVSVDLGMAATFMASFGSTFGSGMHIHHSLVNKNTGESAFFDGTAPDKRSQLMQHWTAGILATSRGAVSMLCPTVNSFRRMRQFAAVPLTATWGEDNKTTALRLISGTQNYSRIEHRVGAADLNPYLALAVIIAGGLAGLEAKLPLAEEFTQMAWGMPASKLDLPSTIMDAAEALKSDTLLNQVLGSSLIDYWAKTREAEWLAFHTEGADAASQQVTLWEYQRYFEMV